MPPHDLPFGYEEPDISSGDVAFYELEAIGNVYHTNFDFVFDGLPDDEGPHHVVEEEEEEDWDREYPPVVPYVPSAEVVARMDDLIRELTDRANLSTFGTTEPRDEHYDEFFRHFDKGRPHCVDFHDDDDDYEGSW